MFKDPESVRVRNSDGLVSDSNPHQVKIGDGVEFAEVTSVNELSVTNADFEYGIGNKTGRSLRGIAADANVDTTESVVSPGLTGRYPFPSTAAQMDIVSTSANDDATGTGARAILVRGLTIDGSDWIDDSELIALDGINPVTTQKSFIRVNSLLVVSVGSTGYNEGVITMTNGADTLHSMVIGDNLTRTAIWSTASNLPAYTREILLLSGKSASSAIFNVYVRPFSLPFVKAFKFVGFEGETSLPFMVPFELAAKTDVEITAASDGGNIDVAAYFELTLVTTS